MALRSRPASPGTVLAIPFIGIAANRAATGREKGLVIRLINTIKRHRELTCHAIYLVVGFGPTSALALSIFGFWSLPVGTVALTFPLILVGLYLVDKSPAASRTAARGFCCGVAAVFIYDLARWTLSARLGLVDFIPNIGAWLLTSDQPKWLAGYLWRYIGNGGGMGMGFAALVAMLKLLAGSKAERIDRRVLGVSYGIAIWVCLLVTLIASPRGEEMMFPLTAQYFWVTLTGHIVYGGVLGMTVESARRETRTIRLPHLVEPALL